MSQGTTIPITHRRSRFLLDVWPVGLSLYTHIHTSSSTPPLVLIYFESEAPVCHKERTSARARTLVGCIIASSSSSSRAQHLTTALTVWLVVRPSATSRDRWSHKADAILIGKLSRRGAFGEFLFPRALSCPALLSTQKSARSECKNCGRRTQAPFNAPRIFITLHQIAFAVVPLFVLLASCTAQCAKAVLG